MNEINRDLSNKVNSLEEQMELIIEQKEENDR
jgi:hypothetical protein